MDFSITYDQVLILFTGALAIILSQMKSFTFRKWGAIVGMLGQPFWFIAAWKAKQLGILIVCVVYTFGWALGVWNYWIAPAIAAIEAPKQNRR